MEELLRELKDCFAWDYTEMPGLSRDLVEYRLPTTKDFKPFKQPPCRMSTEVELQVKEEIVRLVKAKFIRPARYVEWLSNIVPVKKNTGAIRICVDFRNLNLATPKDEYPMPMADLLVDGAAKHEILSFMDGHSGYNQIFIAEEDFHKTTFRCPGSIGTFEGIEIEKNKAKAIIDAPPPKTKKGLQSLLGQINFLRRFIANSAGKVEPLSSLLKLKDEEKFRWDEVHQKAFDSIKEYMTKPPVLIPPKRG
ncbi:hypothetical protein L3X38_042061 [Prunus dulcis]|uniref:Transposable element protein n=1 Tax=Prunus dulcis TaxID=3755 RepID=A0AAD4UW44_PRUDU|nr:hypothetical protein L3X38_042061 [Prunus dulcis]